MHDSDIESLWCSDGQLEVRQRGGARSLSGSFPYGKIATIRDRGRTRKERIRPRAFDYQLRRFKALQDELNEAISEGIEEAQRELIEEQLERANVHILAGHDFGKPLGDLRRGTARVVDSDDSIAFEVDIPNDDDLASYFADTIKEVRSRRAGGVSPGLSCSTFKRGS